MHRDLFGDDGLVQNARAAGRQRGGAGGFAALEQLVRGDIEILRETAYGVGAVSYTHLKLYWLLVAFRE